VLDGVGFSLPVAELAQRGCKLGYRRRDGSPGIASLKLDTKRGRFKVVLVGVAVAIRPRSASDW
jgi:hypothetical protein